MKLHTSLHTLNPSYFCRVLFIYDSTVCVCVCVWVMGFYSVDECWNQVKKKGFSVHFNSIHLRSKWNHGNVFIFIFIPAHTVDISTVASLIKRAFTMQIICQNGDWFFFFACQGSVIWIIIKGIDYLFRRLSFGIGVRCMHVIIPAKKTNWACHIRNYHFLCSMSENVVAKPSLLQMPLSSLVRIVISMMVLSQARFDIILIGLASHVFCVCRFTSHRRIVLLFFCLCVDGLTNTTRGKINIPIDRVLSAF